MPVEGIGVCRSRAVKIGTVKKSASMLREWLGGCRRARAGWELKPPTERWDRGVRFRRRARAHSVEDQLASQWVAKPGGPCYQARRNFTGWAPASAAHTFYQAGQPMWMSPANSIKRVA